MSSGCDLSYSSENPSSPLFFHGETESPYLQSYCITYPRLLGKTYAFCIGILTLGFLPQPLQTRTNYEFFVGSSYPSAIVPIRVNSVLASYWCFYKSSRMITSNSCFWEYLSLPTELSPTNWKIPLQAQLLTVEHTNCPQHPPLPPAERASYGGGYASSHTIPIKSSSFFHSH